MQELPFNIPKSLSSYVEKFDEDPDKVISKLKKHLRKRGPDAVGHFLLSWFYHIREKNDLAIKEALIAKTYAPGSPLMEHLHYFLMHPEKFEASVPAPSYKSSRTTLEQATRTSPILDLDRLIAMLEAVESKKITMPEGGDPANEPDLSKEAESVDDVVSETLAKIHAQQGRKKEAAVMYKKLMKVNKDKAAYYREQIEQLEEKDRN